MPPIKDKSAKGAKQRKADNNKGAKPAPTAAASTAAGAVESNNDRPVLYEVPEVRLYVHPKPELGLLAFPEGPARGPLTSDLARQLLGWEDEPSYTARVLTVQPKLDPKKALFEEWDLLDEDGRKVKLWHNARNRPLEEGHARKLGQDMLSRQWRFNMENIIVGRTGLVESGQHRLVGLVLAEQIRTGKQSMHWADYWQSQVFIETCLAVGADESQETIQTLDNVKSRTLADTLYTSELFRDLPLAADRKECTRMLDMAIDLLWKRTGAAGADKTSASHYQTHSASRDFFGRHPRLEQCVRHLFGENRQRAISKLRLSAGQCAALCYLMGCSETSGAEVDEYHAQSPELRVEKPLSWSRWDMAKQFWARMAKKDDMVVVKEGLKLLVDPNEENINAGRITEKLAILAKAWDAYVERNGEVQEGDLELLYLTDKDGEYHLDPDQVLSFGGIDLGPKVKKVEEVPTEDEVKAAAEALKKEGLEKKQLQGSGRFDDLKAKLLANRAERGSVEDTPKPEPVVLDAQGKPPAPKLKPQTRRQVEAAQTAEAVAADATKDAPASSTE